MKPKAATEHEDGLLEYLEDIIGTAQYKQPIQEAFELLEKQNEERAEKLNRVKIVENQMSAMEVRFIIVFCVPRGGADTDRHLCSRKKTRPSCT